MIKSATETLEDFPYKEIEGLKYYREDHVLQSMVKFRDQFIVNQHEIHKKQLSKKEIEGLAFTLCAINVVTELTGYTEPQLKAKNRDNRSLLDARILLSALVYGHTKDYSMTGRFLNRHRTTIMDNVNSHYILFSEKGYGNKEYRELFLKSMEEMSKLNRGG